MNLKTVLATLGVGAAVVLGIVNFNTKSVPIQVNVSPTPVNVNVPEQAPATVNVAPAPVNVSVPKSDLVGSVSGPDLWNPYFNINGVTRWYSRVKFNQATTTICTIKTPYATSTLEAMTVQFDVSSTSASIVDIAKSVNTGATTTKIGTTYYIDAGAQATIQASTSPAAGAITVFAPSQYVVVNQKGGATNVFSPTGNCSATFQATN